MLPKLTRAGAMRALPLKHPLSAEVLLCGECVVCPTAQSEIVDRGWSTERVGGEMVEFEPAVFAAALAA